MKLKHGRDALPRVLIFSVNKPSAGDEMGRSTSLASLRSLTRTIKADPQVGPTTK